jgi:hypothetical protein
MRPFKCVNMLRYFPGWRKTKSRDIIYTESERILVSISKPSNLLTSLTLPSVHYEDFNKRLDGKKACCLPGKWKPVFTYSLQNGSRRHVWILPKKSNGLLLKLLLKKLKDPSRPLRKPFLPPGPVKNVPGHQQHHGKVPRPPS